MKTTPKTSFLSKLLKLSYNPLLVAIILIPLTLLGDSIYENWRQHTQIQLRATGSYQSFQLPSELFASNDSYFDSVSPDSIEKVVPEIDKLHNSDGNSTSIVLYDYLRNLPIRNMVSELKYVRGFWTFSIENTGTKNIQGLSLNVPFDGYYELIQNEATQSAVGKFDKNIEIGNLKPSNGLKIKVWTDRTAFEIKGEPYFSNLEEKPKVTFEDGYTLVDFTK